MRLLWTGKTKSSHTSGVLEAVDVALMHRAISEEPENVDVIEMSAEEYAQARQRALDSLGVTYDELAQQAKARRFDSVRHRKLWLLIREY